MIVATIPTGLEDDVTVAGAVASAAHAGIRTIRYPGPPREELTSEAELRRIGLELAREAGAEWWLQLDADERLRHGEHLEPILERWPLWAYPLPYVHEDGWTTLAPFKLVRVEAELVAHSDYFRHGGEVYRLSGYSADRERWSVLEAGPHLYHSPSVRAGRFHPRLSDVELELEPRPTDALEFPLSTVKGDAMQTPPEDRSEWKASDGDYYCPGCGARYDTAGTCSGTDASPHEELAVEKVKGESKSKSSSSKDGDKEPAAAGADTSK